nr:MAG: hypothetical protein [Metapenaeopsis lamellata majanivirus]
MFKFIFIGILVICLVILIARLFTKNMHMDNDKIEKDNNDDEEEEEVYRNSVINNSISNSNSVISNLIPSRGGGWGEEEEEEEEEGEFERNSMINNLIPSRRRKRGWALRRGRRGRGRGGGRGGGGGEEREREELPPVIASLSPNSIISIPREENKDTEEFIPVNERENYGVNVVVLK